MTRFCFTLLFSAGALIAGAQLKTDPNFHIYILMGQSNMAGRGEITDEYKDAGHERVLMLDQEGQWVKAKHPLHFDKPKIAGVGLGLSFGVAMAEADPKIKIGLVPCAVGGSSISVWKPGAYDSATKTHPYDDALARIKIAMKAGVIKGVLWHQGESDRKAERAMTYSKDLTELITRIRREVRNRKLPFVMGELGYFLSDYETINRQFKRVMQEVPYTTVVPADGLTHKGDGVHFDSESLEELGERYVRGVISRQ